MKNTTTNLGILSTLVVTAGLLTVSGVAAAAPLRNCAHTSSSSNNSRSWSGSQDGWRVNISSWWNTNNRMSSDWNGWDPSSYSGNHEGSFVTWWNGVMMQASSYNSANWESTSTNNNWMPSSNNWQHSWANWNPMMWEQNGSSYTNWHTQFMNYMNSNKSIMQSEFMVNSR